MIKFALYLLVLFVTLGLTVAREPLNNSDISLAFRQSC